MKTGFNKPDYEHKLDASLGLIFRVNGLFDRIEYRMQMGHLDKANVLLDRIYCNLLYRDPMKVKYNSQGEIVALRIPNEEKKIHAFFNKQIRKCRKRIHDATTPQEKKTAEAKYYRVIELKDIWLRKFMQKLGWYMNEKMRTPGRAMFGGE